jgi:predicted transcriptional regulator
MNVIKLMDHPHLNRQEQLMAFVFKMGMLEQPQLADLMGISQLNVKQLIHNIRSQEGGLITNLPEKYEGLTKQQISELSLKEQTELKQLQRKIKDERLAIKQERDKWISSVRGKERGSSRLYKLGPKGIQLAAKALYTSSYEELDIAQREHFRGLNEILVRLIRKMGRQEIIQHAEWYNTKDAFQELIRIWEWYRQSDWIDDPKLRKEHLKKLARPDGLLILNDQRAWIEYDTGSEDAPQLEDKYKRWANSLVPFNIQDPVVWITPKESRTKKLAALWEYRKSRLKMKYYPNMLFFTAGEDTDFFLTTLQSTLTNQVSSQ